MIYKFGSSVIPGAYYYGVGGLPPPFFETPITYGGGARLRARAADDLTIDHVRKHWELIEQRAAPAVKPVEVKIAEAVDASPNPKLAAADSLLVPRAQVKTAKPATAMAIEAAQASRQTRADAEIAARLEAQLNAIDEAVLRMRRASEDAMVLALLDL